MVSRTIFAVYQHSTIVQRIVTAIVSTFVLRFLCTYNSSMMVVKVRRHPDVE